MSNTTRAVQYGWGPGNPEFDEWNAHRPEKQQCKSVKHQTADRPPFGKQGGKFGRFTKGLKNSRYNLQRKNDPPKEVETL
jgi:hypothetical protein